MVIQGTDSLARLNTHLTSNDFKIRELSAMNLGSISYNAIGKEQCIYANSIPPLCVMLTDKVPEVRTAATRALASLAQYKEGKVQIYDLDKLNEIIALLYDKIEQTRLNVVQLICNVGEYPPAKEKFKECLPKLEQIVKDEKEEFPLVSKYAQCAIDVITWKA